jgi:hypothetical protein
MLKNGKGSTRRPRMISSEEESRRWQASMGGIYKGPPSCDYCGVKTLKAICGVCVGYDQFCVADNKGQRTNTIPEC